MAASGSTVSGYDCELFLNPVPELLKCGLCKQVARDASLTSCCGEHFCKLCIEQIIQNKKPCPSCEEVEFTIFLDKRDNRTILALEVQCALKDRGCDWIGTLKQLDAHLDVTFNNCQYVDVKCPNKCEQPIQKRHLPTHLANECTKRDFFCQYCNFTATYEVVCNDHWPQCPFYPVPCPNGCEIMAIERGDLDAHLMMCSLEVVKCDFSYAGCNVKLVRKEVERHLADNLQRHVLMMNKALQEKIEEKGRKIKQLEARLEEKDREIQEIQEEKDRLIQEQVREHKLLIQELRDEYDRKIQEQIQESEQHIRELQEDKERGTQEREQQIRELQEENDTKIQEQVQEQERQIQELQKTVKEEQEKQIQEKVAQVEAQLVAQRERQIQELQKMVKEEQGKQIQETRARLAQVESQLVAHIQDYQTNRFGIAHFTIHGIQKMKGYWESPPMYTHPGGYKIGIRAYPNGEWWAKGAHVSVYMCKAKGDNDAHLKWPADCTITLQLLNQHRDQDHVTVSKQFQWDKPTARTALCAYSSTCFNSKFIAHKDLSWNAEKQTQYLRNDSLQVRITEIQVHSI